MARTSVEQSGGSPAGGIQETKSKLASLSDRSDVGVAENDLIQPGEIEQQLNVVGDSHENIEDQRMWLDALTTLAGVFAKKSWGSPEHDELCDEQVSQISRLVTPDESPNQHGGALSHKIANTTSKLTSNPTVSDLSPANNHESSMPSPPRDPIPLLPPPAILDDSGKLAHLSITNPSQHFSVRPKSYVHKACKNCKTSHVACDIGRPCQRCIRLDKADSCVDAERKKRGRPSNHSKRAMLVDAGVLDSQASHDNSLKELQHLPASLNAEDLVSTSSSATSSISATSAKRRRGAGKRKSSANNDAAVVPAAKKPRKKPRKGPESLQAASSNNLSSEAAIQDCLHALVAQESYSSSTPTILSPSISESPIATPPSPPNAKASMSTSLADTTHSTPPTLPFDNAHILSHHHHGTQNSQSLSPESYSPDSDIPIDMEVVSAQLTEEQLRELTIAVNSEYGTYSPESTTPIITDVPELPIAEQPTVPQHPPTAPEEEFRLEDLAQMIPENVREELQQHLLNGLLGSVINSVDEQHHVSQLEEASIQHDVNSTILMDSIVESLQANDHEMPEISQDMIQAVGAALAMLMPNSDNHLSLPDNTPQSDAEIAAAIAASMLSSTTGDEVVSAVTNAAAAIMNGLNSANPSTNPLSGVTLDGVNMSLEDLNKHIEAAGAQALEDANSVFSTEDQEVLAQVGLTGFGNLPHQSS
ncbi:hypothetical protein HDV05_004985 [Chytridiales sp. JEL 0842]|nr:hypothetical protein HDV05_004985 [Chytridiales sp. JEL 0842]